MKSQLEDGNTVKYQFEIDDSDWREWKMTVPRTKSLDTRIRELIEADTEGRIVEHDDEEVAEPEPAESQSVSREPQQTVDEAHRGRLREELAGSGDLLERRVDVVLSMYHFLRQRGEAKKDDLLNAVDVEATGYASRESVWSNMVKGKDTLRALPGVENPSTGQTVWRYIDE